MSTMILAVSGGVDSVVMLDLVCRQMHNSLDDIIVAHFDHGVRDNSKLDAKFVKCLADQYGVKFLSETGNLGKKTSEEVAREARYDFLRRVAKEYHAKIYTAHHLDDLVETILINLIRGTGWRGLAILDTPDIERPLLGIDLFYEPLDKAAIFEYAAKRSLKFREDQTNSSDEYLRNRLRHQMDGTGITFEQKIKMYHLWKKQKELKKQIDRLVRELIPGADEVWRRDWFHGMDASIALELLRAGTLRAGIHATRPQLEDFCQAILNYAPGKYFNLPGDMLVKIGKEGFFLN